ncbi:erythromycin esterase family protein [Bacillus sp. 31A1R]|uniref:Erythromycin esterase family protein n=1 Tax=Robertmurraya mangrovi TaxID=3098077 RepID=A0ABU5J3B5_9BACI|nr:erythromycin esterase family protein [Bacillus sp. 31A1R]MDZ5473836.1 erythromycin esterase family protein [Bacillus sp. 31A1R]
MSESIVKAIKAEAKTFEGIKDLDPIIDAIGDAQYVLLGEASHGTSEFYTVRSEITKRLIKEKGFQFIGVEGDWPSCFKVNSYIKGYEEISPEEALSAFNRWPTWMWANEEIMDLIIWLKEHNQGKQSSNVGFYGIDVYSLWESMDEILKVLGDNQSNDIEAAKKAFSCFEPFERKPEYYGVSAAFYGEECTDEVVQLLLKVRENKHKFTMGPEDSLNLSVNSLVTLNAEAYYRTMVKGGPDDWNIRDHHMVSAVEEIANYYGPGAKGIIWEHNTHIGDARATDMVDEGLVNVGQIMREKHNKKVYSIGFGTYKGTVIAAKKWGEDIEVMPVPEGVEGSWEQLLNEAGAEDKILVFTEENKHLFNQTIGHRAIGVVYNPEYEHLGNYVPSKISERYDSFIFINETKALKPLTMRHVYV